MKNPILDLRPVSDEFYEVSNLLIERFSEQRFWLFDLEATGLDTRRERVTQIAGVPLEGGRILEKQAFTQFVELEEGVEIPKVVQDLTGITRETLRGAPPFREAWERHLEAAGEQRIWVGQSVFEFDVPLLEAEFKRHGMPAELPPVLDSVMIATHLLGESEERWSTTRLLARFEVDIGGLRRHDALDDVKILGRILLPIMDLVREGHGDLLRIPSDRPVRVRRHPPVTDSD